MNVLNQFVDSDSDSDHTNQHAAKRQKTSTNVDFTGLPLSTKSSALPVAVSATNGSSLRDPAQSNVNVPLSEHRSMVGPQRPGQYIQPPQQPQTLHTSEGKKIKEHPSAQVNTARIDHHAFHEQFQSFQRHGFAANTGGDTRAVIGNIDAYRSDVVSSSSQPQHKSTGKTAKRKAKLAAKKRQEAQEFDINGSGSWYSVLDAAAIEAAKQKQEIIARPESESKSGDEGGIDGWKSAFDVHSSDFVESKYVERTEFHGAQELDYQGRSYMYPPTGHPPHPPTRFGVPSKCVVEWKAHIKGVNVLRFLPGTGHLLATASMDSTVKIFDVHSSRKCLRTIHGHEMGVRDVNFTNDGRHFITASFDKYVKYFDTETGQLVSKYSSKKIPFCATFHPLQQHSLLVGQSDAKIAQWDLREEQQEEPEMTYNEHLGPVNSITFLGDDGRFFVSSSDDRKLVVWEYGMPVMAHQITEDGMMSMPTVACHPKGKFFAANSVDNQIRVIQASGKFQISRKKKFKGHLTSGVVVHLGFAPDGSRIISGDGEGRLFVWDWKTMKLLKRMPAHSSACTGVAWHPCHDSIVATAGWDGVVKLWQ